MRKCVVGASWKSAKCRLEVGTLKCPPRPAHRVSAGEILLPFQLYYLLNHGRLSHICKANARYVIRELLSYKI